MKKQNITLGVIIGNRDFFPDKLVSEARADVLKVLEEQGIEAILLGRSIGDRRFTNRPVCEPTSIRVTSEKHLVGH